MNRSNLAAVHTANTFSLVLRQWLTKEQMIEVVKRNRETDNEALCASHDFCDANMAMLEAFTAANGHEPSAESDEDTRLWNEAWEMAKAANFTQIRPSQVK